MACFSPLYGFRSNRLSDNGKRQIVFRRQYGFVDLELIVPCGTCIGCRLDRAREWAIRCYHESKCHVFNSFITLTYSDEKLPPRSELVKSDLQKFFKRLRDKGYVFRYFACGEYGPLHGRPHYHLLLLMSALPTVFI